MTNPAFLPPDDTTDFGDEFNYAQWTADTVITLTNVPWNNDYRDVVKFDDQAALDTYLDSNSVTNTRIDDSTYANVEMPVRLDIPFNKAFTYNYLRASNPAQPIPGDTPRSFYYFVVGVRRVAPNTTEFIVQLDIWSTFIYGVTFGQSFIERGHIGIANENQMSNHGRDYLTIPEGLDGGGELRTVQISRKGVMYPFGAEEAAVLVCSTVDLDGDFGTEESPNLPAATGGLFSLMPSGATYYVFQNGTSFNIFLSGISNKPWISQGIISVTLIPNMGRYFPGFSYNSPGVPTKAPQAAPQNLSHTMAVNWRDGFMSLLPERYQHLKKFLTYPYTAVEMTTWSGTPIIIKPESWNDENATVNERANLVPPTQRLVFMPKGYNANNPPAVSGTAGDDGGEFLDFATMIQSLPTLAIVNNNASMYMAMNANSVAFQNQSADWSQQKALRGNEVSYDQASSGIELAGQLGVNSRNADIAQTHLGNQALAQQTIWKGLAGVGGGGAMGAVGGAAGAAVGSMGGMVSSIGNNVSALMQQNTNSESLGIRNAANARATGMQQSQGGYIRDTNKNLADFAARGDYENTIASINAKVQDSRMAQPTTSGQVGGDAMNLIHLNMEISLRWKMIDPAHIQMIGDYWLRYGYAVSRFGNIPQSLMVMSKFTYWKLSETYIRSAKMTEPHKQAIRGLLEKGVTVWKNPNDIGMIDWADNEPLEGITL